MMYPPIARLGKTIEESNNEYKTMYTKSIEDPHTFWSEEARKYLSWSSPFDNVMGGSINDGDVNWFSGGKLNACYNCIDKHLPTKADQVILFIYS